MRSWNAGVAVLLVAPLLSSAAVLSLEQQETFLRTAKIVRTRTLSEGTTGSKLVTLTDGKLTHDAQIQTIDEYHPKFTGALGTELNFQDTYKGNIAAYRLDKLLGLGMTPPSVERTVGGSSAAVTWWVDDVLMTEKQRFLKKREPPDSDHWNRQMYIVRIFDQLIYNMDRNLGNLVITKDWDLRMIDHTRAFRLHKKLKNPKNLTRCDWELARRLRALNEAELLAELKPYLTKGQVRALLARRDLILKQFEKLAKQQGEATVYYDFLAPRLQFR